jgi:hypothetical protein
MVARSCINRNRSRTFSWANDYLRETRVAGLMRRTEVDDTAIRSCHSNGNCTQSGRQLA